MLLVAIIILIYDGRPLFYKGVRLGRGKKSFVMYKFRTLVPDADKLIGNQILHPRQRLMTPLGKFLRDTRLDELPQLCNILKGDMDFVGPRPVRPAIYESMCQKIKNYDKRFTVRPGLIGFAQLFTPHGAPKEMRSLIDNALLQKKENILWDIYVLTFTAAILAKTTTVKTSKFLYKQIFLCRICRCFQEKRAMERIHPRGGRVTCGPSDGTKVPVPLEAELVDINAEAFLMRSSVEIPRPFPSLFQLYVPVGKTRKGMVKYKKAICTGSLYRETKTRSGQFEYAVMYNPISPLNQYVVHQYFLHESIA